ncbi:hypothetical protein D3C78_1363940 [compost metagenome]
MERAVDVHVLQRLPLGGAHLHHRFAVLVAGIADQHVDGEPVGLQSGDSGSHRRAIGHVEGGAARLDPVFRQPRASGFAGLDRQVVDHDLRAGHPQAPRDGEAQSPGRARHQRDAPRETERLVQIVVFQACLLVLYAPNL